jgi:hypothetical protein
VSTRSIQDALDLLESMLSHFEDDGERAKLDGARVELEAIRQAAKDLDRLGIGDFTCNVRDRVGVIASTHNSESTWNHPDVKAWSDASVLLATIAKES